MLSLSVSQGHSSLGEQNSFGNSVWFSPLSSLPRDFGKSVSIGFVKCDLITFVVNLLKLQCDKYFVC